MSVHDDFEDEMDVELSDEAIEAYLSGRNHPQLAGETGLALLADDVARASVGQPPAPDPEILGRFFTPTMGTAANRAGAVATPPVTAPPTVVPLRRVGTDPSPSRQPAVAATPATDPSQGGATVLPFRRRAGLGAVAGVAAALIASSVAVAGSTGSLPAPAQRVFVAVVEAVTPFEVREPAPGPEENPAPNPPGEVGTGSGEGPAGEVGTGSGEGPAGSGSPASPGGPVSPGNSAEAPGIDRAGETPAGTVGNVANAGGAGNSGQAGPPTESPGTAGQAGPPADLPTPAQGGGPPESTPGGPADPGPPVSTPVSTPGGPPANVGPPPRTPGNATESPPAAHAGGQRSQTSGEPSVNAGPPTGVTGRPVGVGRP